jgi:hypothetical protein
MKLDEHERSLTTATTTKMHYKASMLVTDESNLPSL